MVVLLNVSCISIADWLDSLSHTNAGFQKLLLGVEGIDLGTEL